MLTDNNKRNKKMSNTLWKIRFFNYEPIDLRDIESYSIEQNVDDTSPIREREMNEKIEREFEDNILTELDHVLSNVMCSVDRSRSSKYFTDKYFKDRHYRQLYYRELYVRDNNPKIEPFKYTVISYLADNEKVFANHFDNIEKWRDKLCFAKKNIFECLSDYKKKELKDYLILKKREKLFTVEFCLKDKTTVKWGAYKTKEEAEIVYNKVDAYFKKVDTYFKKTFKHFYENLDNQEIYSL